MAAAAAAQVIPRPSEAAAQVAAAAQVIPRPTSCVPYSSISYALSAVTCAAAP